MGLISGSMQRGNAKKVSCNEKSIIQNREQNSKLAKIWTL